MTWELHLGDCLDYMRGMADDAVTAIVTDPPYGIDVTNMTLGNGAHTIYRGNSEWDKSRPSAECFREMLRVSHFQIIWGGNYFADYLPASRCWLVWDKLTGKNDFADCELAWTNLDMVVKKYSRLWLGANAKDTPERVHPTQKPIDLMMWCLEKLPQGCTILDPFAGSGTTGVACLKTGRRFIGCEIDPHYHAIAVRRLEDAAAQLPLFSAMEMQP